VAALLHPFTISSTLFLLSPLDLVAAAIFLSKLSVGPFVCSLLTFGHTNEHVVLFIGSVGCPFFQIVIQSRHASTEP